MISEIDIKDWDNQIKQARQHLAELDDYADINDLHLHYESKACINGFINNVEDFMKKNTPQIPALFKAPI